PMSPTRRPRNSAPPDRNGCTRGLRAPLQPCTHLDFRPPEHLVFTQAHRLSRGALAGGRTRRLRPHVFTWPASGQSEKSMNELLPLMLEGAWVTVQVTFFGSLLAIAVALVAAFGRLSPIAPLRWLAISYIEVFRGSSLLVQLFWLYFVLPMPPFNVSL